MIGELLSYFKQLDEMEKEMLESAPGSVPFYAKHFAEQYATVSLTPKNYLLSSERSLNVYKHPRFVAFPDHSHDFMEMVYMYSGSGTHVIDGETTLTLQTNDLLFLRPGVSHTIEPAGYNDIGIHIQIYPSQLNYPTEMLKEDTYLRRFLVNCIMEHTTGPDYLHFHLSDITEAKNLLENMMMNMFRNEKSRQPIMLATLGVLLMELLNRTYKITLGSPTSYEQEIVLDALAYIEDNYQTASLDNYAASIHQPPYFVSRLMKKYSPYTFTTYVQRKRLSHACYLLTSTNTPVEDISRQVGYENSSYFHKIFKQEYNMTPKKFRTKHES